MPLNPHIEKYRKRLTDSARGNSRPVDFGTCACQRGDRVLLCRTDQQEKVARVNVQALKVCKLGHAVNTYSLNHVSFVCIVSPREGDGNGEDEL